MTDEGRAYVDALKLLARRELSEAQVRQRLVRKGHAASSIDYAVERLCGERALDDQRFAETMAHRAASARLQSRRRIRQRLERAGIDAGVARHAVAAVDDGEQLAAALTRRLRGRTALDEREFLRLYRYLTAQGFDADRVLAALKAHRPG